ncbi:7172_t:CDS:2 [Entrophospora sp. SA101]|nr:7172_t:CDS:2 [Entrophospora sp. SA101]
MVNAQKFLKELINLRNKRKCYGEREKITSLGINSQILRKKGLLKVNEYLENSLNLEGFINLQNLDCSFNKITNLILNDCSQLIRLDCSYNQLVNLGLEGLNQLEKIVCRGNYLIDLDYSVLDPKKITYLDVVDNNLSKRDLSIFSRFINLQKLLIGNDEKFNKINRNYFFGSLKSIESLTKLEGIHIGATDIADLQELGLFLSERINITDDWQTINQEFTSELQQE